MEYIPLCSIELHLNFKNSNNGISFSYSIQILKIQTIEFHSIPLHSAPFLKSYVYTYIKFINIMSFVPVECSCCVGVKHQTLFLSKVSILHILVHLGFSIQRLKPWIKGLLYNLVHLVVVSMKICSRGQTT
jgi:hypothetical protein